MAKQMIEAYGVKGMSSKVWRKTFTGPEALEAWREKNNAQVTAVRELQTGVVAAHSRACPHCDGSGEIMVIVEGTIAFQKCGGAQ